MDWLDFKPWSRDVERFVREQIQHEASRRPESPDPRASNPRDQLQDYAERCHHLLELSSDPEADKLSN